MTAGVRTGEGERGPERERWRVNGIPRPEDCLGISFFVLLMLMTVLVFVVGGKER